MAKGGITMADNRLQIMRIAGFTSGEIKQSLTDSKLTNPLSLKNFKKGHWFYETVVRTRHADYMKFKQDAKVKGLTPKQFNEQWLQKIKDYYKQNNWGDFWQMFRQKEKEAGNNGWDTTPRPTGNKRKYERTKHGYMAKLNRDKIRQQRNNRR